MTGKERSHKEKALWCVAQIDNESLTHKNCHCGIYQDHLLRAAQVHATLAIADAIIGGRDKA